MRRSTLLCFAVLALACAQTDEQANAPADTGAAAPAAPAAISLADVRGTWTMRAMPENSDSVLTTYQLWTADDPANWKMKFDNRSDTLAVHVISVAGDSIVAHIGPYRSALRNNVMVTTETVYRLENGELVGRSVARYEVSTPDSVLIVRTRGTRNP